MLCCKLGDSTADILSLSQLHELSKRVRAVGFDGGDASRELTENDLARLGYPPSQAARIVRLLSREALLDAYLAAGARVDVSVLTWFDARFPERLRERLGAQCPPVLFCKGELALLQSRCVAVVGSRKIGRAGAQFAAQAGRLAAQESYTLCSGGAQGADQLAQAACLKAGGQAVIFPATELAFCPVRADTLYVAEDGFELGFTVPRALGRNRLIHALGEKTLVAQTDYEKGGTWGGSISNLKHGYSELYVHADRSEGAQALIARGAIAVNKLTTLAALSPSQMKFPME